MKRLFPAIFLLFLFSQSSFAQPDNANAKLARIHDAAGYALLHKGPGVTFPAKDTIKASDFFYCLVTDSAWYKVYDLFGNYEGTYIDRNKIQIIEQLPDKEQITIIQTGFAGMRMMDSTFQNFNNTKHSGKEISNMSKQHTAFVDYQYHPAMRVFEDYFIRTGDSVLFQEFLSICCGDADEEPSYAIAKCFANHPDVVIGDLRKLSNKESVRLYLGDIDFGLQNIFYAPKGKNNDKLDVIEDKLTKAYPVLLGRNRKPDEYEY